MKKCKVTSVRKIGIRKTYNMTMASGQHNYALYDADHNDRFVISRNSCCYGFLSYQTAYLKANFPEEFAISSLNTFGHRANWDHVDMMEKEAKRMGIHVLPRDISKCGVEWKIARKKDKTSNILQSEIRPGLMSKGVGEAAATNISETGPHKDLRSLAENTSSVINTGVIGAMIDNGFFNGKKGIDNKDEIIEKFSGIRKDIKALRKRGRRSGDLFD